MTHLQIINKSLMFLGSQSLENLSGSDPITERVLSVYDDIWITILGQFPWYKPTKIYSFTGAEDDNLRAYYVDLPSYMVSIKQIMDSSQSSIRHNCIFIGSKMLTDYETGYIVYVSSEGIIPVDTVTDPTPYVTPYMEECAALLLAYSIAFKTTQNVDLTNSLYRRYQESLKSAISLELKLTGAGYKHTASWDVRGLSNGDSRL